MMTRRLTSVFCRTVSTIGLIGALAAPALAQAQTTTAANAASSDDTDVIIVQGIRQSLASALEEKRSSDNIVEVIQAEDIGKLPDQNLAEVLENVTGVQIDRTAGVGTGVQIRGTGANRVEINGVSTVGSGNGRSGISFDDLPAALISSVEVTKVAEAKTIEGSVGGTINLRTIRPLDLKETLISLRAQGEHSDLSGTITPRFSATVGDKWSTGIGEIGVVMSASYAELDVTSFDPRFDRDREVLPNSGRLSAEAFPFLRTQFLDQQIYNFEYETKNFTGSVEWEPSDNLKLYFDATINDQQRKQQSARAFASGTGANVVVDATNNTAFETVNLGTIDGPNGPLVLGEIQAVLSGVLGVARIPNRDIESNFRTTSTTGSRLTDSKVLALGGEWESGRLTVRAEGSLSESNSVFPSFNTELDFINPRGPQPAVGQSSDNGVPFIFDASNGMLQFGIAPGLAETPTSAELLNPANYALRSVTQGASSNDNKETAFRLDLRYDAQDILPFFSSVDVGYRWNKSQAINNESSLISNFVATTSPTFFRPRADRFAAFVTPGPDNFDAADGRTLFFPDYLVIDPRVSLNNPADVLAGLNTAIQASNAANNVNLATLGTPTDQLAGFFRIDEKTNALYLQGNYDTEVAGMTVRGNLGIRWVKTNISSTGINAINNVSQGEVVTRSDYSFFLPRWSLVAEPAKDFLVRAGISRDLRRPDFNDLSSSINFGGNAGAIVSVGNPALEPETVWSFDLSGEYYFSNSGFVSLGVFHKRRTNLFGTEVDNPVEPRSSTGQIERDITAPCEGGGIFNPIANRNVFSSVQGTGICVPLGSRFNVDGVTTQTGLEFAAQASLADFIGEDSWLAGFGVIGNLTLQREGGNVAEFRNGNGDGNALNLLLGRTDTNQSTPTLADDVVQERITLTNLSKTAYNLTLFYDKYGLNFRARYSWRSNFRTNDLISFDLPRIVDDRGQLNASISYAVTDNISVGVEGINLLREDRTEWCVNDNALLCAQGLTDRRIVGGLSVKF